MATIEGEIEGKCFPGGRRTACIDDVERGEKKRNGKKIRL